MLELGYFAVAEWRLLEWEQTYYPLDVRNELLRMKAWLDANPRRRKKNYNRFIVNWLSKESARVRCDQAKVYKDRLAAQNPQGNAVYSASDIAYYNEFYAKHPDLKPADWQH